MFKSPLLKFLFLQFVCYLFIVILINSCSKNTENTDYEPRIQEGSLDTLQYHVERGDQSLQDKKYNIAKQAYQRALTLKNNYSPALSGLAVADAYIATENISSKTSKQRSFKKSVASLKQAEAFAETQKEKSRYHNFAIQVYYLFQLPVKNWYEKTKYHYKQSIKLGDEIIESHLFMARAASMKHNYKEAIELYNKILELNVAYQEVANEDLATLQKIQRAKPGSKFGKEIAFIPKISKADISALFITELQLQKLYKEQKKEIHTGFKIPKNQRNHHLSNTTNEKVKVIDIQGHPMEDVILDILVLQVKGLEVGPSYKFYPNQPITRSEYALMLQDILIKITKDEKLATQYIGDPSPFPDVRSDIFYYNAARVMVQRDLMNVTNSVTGEFSPQKEVSGAEALLAIRNLKTFLRSYLR